MSEHIMSVDTAAAHFLSTIRTPFLNEFFLFITQFGSTSAMIALSIAAILFYSFFSKRRYIIPFLVAAIGSAVSINLIKMLVARARPAADVAFYAEKLFSFPSGHSASALAILGFIAYTAFKNVRTTCARVCILGGAALLILLIGFSRLYLGVHYLSDVIGGYVLGTLWLLIGIRVDMWLNRKR
ncbi:phosphatase PAP2 family protein [Patescibacteria group bacterium]|nr:phosphatase PAP2 family protein [Patescibacteria group bacterium]